MTHEPHTCLQCGKPFGAGSRTDKLFCGGKCKTDYHNVIKTANELEIKKVLEILKRNRVVLKALLGSKPEVVVPRETLLKRGFDFDFHTHHVISQIQQNEFIFSFNYGYRVLGQDLFKIVKSFK